MQNVPGEKTADGIKMVRFTRNYSCFLRLGELCEFQGIKTAAAPKKEETLEASRIIHQKAASGNPLLIP